MSKMCTGNLFTSNWSLHFSNMFPLCSWVVFNIGLSNLSTLPSRFILDSQWLYYLPKMFGRIRLCNRWSYFIFSLGISSLLILHNVSWWTVHVCQSGILLQLVCSRIPLQLNVSNICRQCSAGFYTSPRSSFCYSCPLGKTSPPGGT
jgi:hypothetical protein